MKEGNQQKEGGKWQIFDLDRGRSPPAVDNAALNRRWVDSRVVRRSHERAARINGDAAPDRVPSAWCQEDVGTFVRLNGRAIPDDEAATVRVKEGVAHVNVRHRAGVDPVCAAMQISQTTSAIQKQKLRADPVQARGSIGPMPGVAYSCYSRSGIHRTCCRSPEHEHALASRRALAQNLESALTLKFRMAIPPQLPNLVQLKATLS